MTKMNQWIGVIVFLAQCLDAGGVGTTAATLKIEGWYRTIEKLPWNSPGWIFIPFWTRHYISMAVVCESPPLHDFTSI